MLVSKIDVSPPQAKKIWKFWSKIAKFAHFGVSESGVRTAFQVLAKLVLTPGPEQVLACVQHLAHLSVSIPVPTPFKRWNRTPGGVWVAIGVVPTHRAWPGAHTTI